MKTFYEVPPVRIWLVRVPYTPTPGAAPNVPSQFDISMLASWLRRAYPTAEVRDTQMFMPTQPGPPGYEDDDDDGIDENRDGFLCDDLNSDLAEWVQSMQAQHPNTRYYGVVSDAGGLFMRGCAEIGGRFGSGPAGPGDVRLGQRRRLHRLVRRPRDRPHVRPQAPRVLRRDRR